MSEIFLDFEDENEMATYFDFYTNGGVTFNTGSTAASNNNHESVPGGGTKSAYCQTTGGTSGGCRQVSKQTFNLPISVEFYYRVQSIEHREPHRFGIWLWATEPTRDNSLGYPKTGTFSGALWHFLNPTQASSFGYNGGNAGSFFRGIGDTATSFLPSSGYNGQIDNLSTYGKMSLDITVTGAVTVSIIEYDANGTVLNDESASSQMADPSVLTDFHIELGEYSYKHTCGGSWCPKKYHIDNLRIQY